MKLNLGSSRDLLEGFLNVDCRELDGVDFVCDLNQYPWPWSDNSIDEIFIAHTLEHLKDGVCAMKEMHRILKPEGKIKVIVPSGNGYMAHFPGHYGLYSRIWFDCFQNSVDNQEQLDGLFTNIKIQLRLWHHNRNKHSKHKFLAKVTEPIWSLIESLGNHSEITQTFWEAIGIFPPAEIWFMAKKRGT